MTPYRQEPMLAFTERTTGITGIIRQAAFQNELKP